MLTFTTTDPYCLFGGEQSELLVPARSPKVNAPVGLFANLYLHGDIQGKAGFDIACPIDGELSFSPGEHECVVELPAGKTECVMVMWQPAWAKGPEYKALIVDKADAESLKYARKRAAERANIL